MWSADHSLRNAGVLHTRRAGQPRSTGSISDRARYVVSSPNEVFTPFLWSIQPPAHCVLSTLFSEMQRMDREADRSFSSSSEVGNECSYDSSSSPICLPTRRAQGLLYLLLSALSIFNPHLLVFHRQSHFSSSAQG